MQFGGRRTNMDLEPIGEPVNLLIKITDDILPSPDAVMVTKITPQMTRADGISEIEFARQFVDEIATPGTIMVGYNNVRFDDEFMRHLLWRNFHDPYEWSWSDNRSRWDLLDVVRLVRALRPDGISWSFNEKEGKKIPTVNLVDMARANGFENEKAHDALADVDTLIKLAKLLKEKQPKMWDYLLKMRDKREVAKLVNIDDPQPFIYASGRYSAEFEKTTVALPLAPSGKPGAVIVYDLRIVPETWAEKDLKELVKIANASYEERKSENFTPLPAKELSFNRCPAVAPIGTLDDAAKKRLKIDMEIIESNFNYLRKNRGLVDKLVAAVNSRPDFASGPDVEGQLYDSFTPDTDRVRVRAVAAAPAEDLADFHPTFTDERLPELLFRYKARNFPTTLNESEQKKWEEYRTAKFQREIPKFMESLTRLAKAPNADDFLLQELQLWAESIAPMGD